MTYRKKLIEVALPLEAINKASAREKSIRHGHPSTLHIWWARRPLAACRAVIFASLVDDPDDPDAHPGFVEACKKLPKGKNAAANDTPRQRLFDFIERLVTWEATTDEAIIKQARDLIQIATDGNPPPLLDPFAGGGSIPLEAQRLGLEAHASDLNPVAVMINKAMIEIPPKFANLPPVNPRDREGTGGSARWKGASGLAADVRYYGEWMKEKAEERIGYLYPKCNDEIVIAWLWTRTVKCPNPACGVQMPLVRNFNLSTKKNKKVWVEPYVDLKSKKIIFSVKNSKTEIGPYGSVDRRGAVCIACNTPVHFDFIRKEGRSGRMTAQLMAIVTEGSNGRNYHSPIEHHAAVADVPIPNNIPETELPEQALGFRVQLYGMTKHQDLFTHRQLTALTTFSNLVDEARKQIYIDGMKSGLSDDKTNLHIGGEGAQAYADAISVYLAFGVDRGANYWSSFTVWADFIVQTFSRQALPMVWDFSEANPFSNSSGNWDGAINWIEKCISYSIPANKPGYVYQKDVQQPFNGLGSLTICTDPPYYDNIGYADLSDFFYVWMRQSLKEIFPDLFSTLLVPKSTELIATPFRHKGDISKANKYFESSLQSAFINMSQNLLNDYPMTLFYAFKQSEEIPDEGITSSGWETMLSGLINAGYSIVGTWPMRTERDQGLKSGANVLSSSIVLVCRQREGGPNITSRREFINSLRQELPLALNKMQSGNIAPVDLAQASIGPGMAVYSRYNKVLEPNGDRMNVRSALQLINQELDAYLAEQEGFIDEDSRFAVSWFEQFGFKEGPFGQADVLARAKNTSVDGLVNAGVLESGAGIVRLFHWSELDPGWDPSTDKRLTTWEATHYLIERLNSHGEEGVAHLLARIPQDLAAEARQLAYRLYSVCDRRGWAAHARDYNALVVSWGTSQEQAQVFKDQYQQGNLFE